MNQLITTTELRTKTTELVRALQEGRSVDIIHRSKVIGQIKPAQDKPKPLTEEDVKKLEKLAQALNLPKLSYKERERRYKKHLIEKYGQGLS